MVPLVKNVLIVLALIFFSSPAMCQAQSGVAANAAAPPPNLGNPDGRSSIVGPSSVAQDPSSISGASTPGQGTSSSSAPSSSAPSAPSSNSAPSPTAPSAPLSNSAPSPSAPSASSSNQAPLPGNGNLAGGTASAKKGQLEDYTNKLKLTPGVAITFPIVEGIDTRRKRIGNYDFTANIQDAGSDGFAYKWTMSAPAEAHGLRAVAPEDEKDSTQVSLFYQDGQSLTMGGFTNTVRVSDALFKGLKSGKTLPFQIDLEDRHDIPTRIKMVGKEYVNVFVDGKKARVRALKTETDNRWHYWIMDNPEFPIMVQGDGPFKWRDPRFSLTDSESRRVISDLEKNGVATTYAILFAFNSAKLENSSKQILNGISVYLRKNVNFKLAVEGHCDIVGQADYNLKLSQKRANAVRDYLVSKGVASARLLPKGYGFSQPVADNITAAGRAKNRRVVFRKM